MQCNDHPAVPQNNHTHHILHPPAVPNPNTGTTNPMIQNANFHRTSFPTHVGNPSQPDPSPTPHPAAAPKSLVTKSNAPLSDKYCTGPSPGSATQNPDFIPHAIAQTNTTTRKRVSLAPAAPSPVSSCRIPCCAQPLHKHPHPIVCHPSNTIRPMHSLQPLIEHTHPTTSTIPEPIYWWNPGTILAMVKIPKPAREDSPSPQKYSATHQYGLDHPL